MSNYETDYEFTHMSYRMVKLSEWVVILARVVLVISIGDGFFISIGDGLVLALLLRMRVRLSLTVTVEDGTVRVRVSSYPSQDVPRHKSQLVPSSCTSLPIVRTCGNHP